MHISPLPPKTPTWMIATSFGLKVRSLGSLTLPKATGLLSPTYVSVGSVASPGFKDISTRSCPGPEAAEEEDAEMKEAIEDCLALGCFCFGVPSRVDSLLLEGRCTVTIRQADCGSTVVSRKRCILVLGKIKNWRGVSVLART